MQELCRYANERGVRILPGVAINAYGGIVWEMDHPYNLATWLRQHPELAARMERPAGFQIPDLGFPLYFPRGDYAVRGCPSRPENQRWMEEGIAWLAETCEIGGINIEAGDYGVCGCDLCEARRGEREDAGRREGYAESWSHADMADYYPRLYEAALAKRPDLWIYSEIQWDNLLDPEAQAPLGSLPRGGVYQHTLNRTYWNRVKAEMTPEYGRSLPTKTNVLRCQFCEPVERRPADRALFLQRRDFAEMAWKAREVGFHGLTVWGEVSPYNAATELELPRLRPLLLGPDRSPGSASWRRTSRRCLGGEAAATRFLDLTDAFDHDPTLDGAALARMQAEALDAARHPDDAIGRRWLSLADRIARRRFTIGV